METKNSEKRLYRDDILRAKKAALKLTNEDLLSDQVRTRATVIRTMKGKNVDLVTLSSIASDLGLEMSELFIFNNENELSGIEITS